MTLTQKLDRIPPCVARILASTKKSGGKLQTDRELMDKTGWSETKLLAVYRRDSWAGVKVDDADRFLQACGLSWSSQRDKRWLLSLAMRRGGIRTMRHLKLGKMNSKNVWRASQLARLLKRIEKILSERKQT